MVGYYENHKSEDMWKEGVCIWTEIRHCDPPHHHHHKAMMPTTALLKSLQTEELKFRCVLCKPWQLCSDMKL
jgi:hypothetical protein